MEDQQLPPVEDALKHIAACTDKPFLEERYIDTFRGRGVFTNQTIEPATFVVEYRGKILLKDVNAKKKYGDCLRNYVFEFSWKGERWSIDASDEDNTLGRLVNDNHVSPNCEVKKIVCEGKPHLCLFAVREICPDEEITYNYGSSFYFWRCRDYYEEPSTSHTEFETVTLKKGCDDLGAVSSFENSGFDDDDGDSKADWLASNFEKPLERPQHSKASYTQQDFSLSASDDNSRDGDYVDNEAKLNSTITLYTKKNYCYVCGAGVSKISRHLLKHADEEPDIAAAFAKRKKSSERKKLLEVLRNRGNYKHNQEVLEKNSGMLKISRRSKKRFSTKELRSCPYCKAMHKRKHVWQHAARCVLRPMCAAQDKTKVQSTFPAESPFQETLPANVWRLLFMMQQDDVTSVVQNDFLLLKLAQSLFKNYKNTRDNYKCIAQKLRQMGKLLMVLHDKCIYSFEDAIKPKNFNKVVEAVRGIAGFDEQTQRYENPSLALKLWHWLKTICVIALIIANGKEEITVATKESIELCKKEWSECASQTPSASSSKTSNPSTLQVTHDVQAFCTYLEKTALFATERLITHGDPLDYNELCRVTLAQTLVLNNYVDRVAKMTVDGFQESDGTIQLLSEHFPPISAPCKRNASILFTPNLIEAMKLLVSKRGACGVHSDNTFLFARPDSSPTSLFHGAATIRVLSSLCHAKCPEHLSSVSLHKHVARIFQILNLDNDDLCRLATLLGRDICAERAYYRSPAATVDIAKLAKLVQAKEEGSLDTVKGNSLDEVEIEDFLEPDLEQISSETDNAEDDNESNVSLKQKGDVRKSSFVLRNKKRQLTPEQDALEHIRACRDKPFLEQKFINPDKGRGVFTSKLIPASTFVVEYHGIISREDSSKVKHRECLDNYLFHFSCEGTNWCTDASQDDGSLGRLVNDNHINPNCKIKKIFCDGKPHICLFAITEISPGEEITYSYGNSSYPWRSMDSDGDDASSSAESCGDDDYVPGCEPVSDDSSSSQNSRQTAEDSSARKSKEDLTDNSDSTSDKDQRSHASTTKAQNYCLICGKASSKISRHLFTHKKEAPEIAEAFKLPKHSKTRHRLLDKLRKQGNFRHYEKTQKTNSRQITDVKAFAHCVYCKGLYVRTNMWRHMSQCSLKKPSTSGFKNKVSTLISATETIESNETSIELIQMFEILKKDKAVSVVANDPLLVQLARYIWHTSEAKSKPGLILQTLKLMGRLLLKLRKDSILSLDDAAKPQNFSKLVEAVRELAGYDRDRKTYMRSGIVYKLFKSLEKVGNIKFARALQENADKQAIEEVEAYLQLCADKWRCLKKLQIKTTETLPFIQDVQVIYQYLDSIATSAVESLTLYECPPVYEALLRVTASQVSIFNKNVEIFQVSLRSFNEREEQENPDNAAVHEVHLDQILPKHFVKFNVRHQGKQMTFILTPQLLAALTLLISKRESCGVSKNNPFLFAKPDNSQRFLHGRSCTVVFINRSEAKDKGNLKAPQFHRHMLRIFQILSLTADELDQLAKQLGQNLPTDREHYQMPEAAIDIAKIMELLSAMENGDLQRFEGRPFEEVEIADKLEAEMEILETSKPEKDDEESENTLQTYDVGVQEDGRKRKESSSRKGSRAKRKKREKETETGTNEEKWSEQTPESCDVEPTPPNTSPHPHHNSTRASFSDDDEDMNVDFDLDIDTDDDARNEKNDGDWKDCPREVSSITGASPDRLTNKEGFAETGDTHKENHEKKKGQTKRRTSRLDAQGGRSSTSTSPEMKSKLHPAPPLMKEVKILIPRLNIDKAQSTVHISKLNSLKNHPDLKENQHPSSGTTDTPSDTTEMQMICSCCKKILRRGQTAFQKKGFIDVFCSKNCLFQMFPTNKTLPKTCHQCQKVILQPLDLIMAAVDIKGTMKDFCSVACLASFKSNAASRQSPQPVCSICKKHCSDAREITLNEVVHKVCSDCSLEDSCSDNPKKCEHCSLTCQEKSLVLLLEEDSKRVCSLACLEALKENLDGRQWCTLCHTPSLISDMVHHQCQDNSVELFCTSTCVSSYILYSPNKVKKSSFWLQKRKELKQQSNPKISGSAENETEEMPKVFLAQSSVICSLCEKEVSKGETLYQKEKSPKLFCSLSCLSKSHPRINFVIIKCYNCFQVIMRPHNMILAPVDDSGTMKELCSDACLSSVNSRRNTAAHNRPLQTGCKSCARTGSCKTRVTLDGLTFSFCSDACFIQYHKANNFPEVFCNMCCSVCSDKPLVLKDDDGIKIICSDKCLVTFKESVKAPQPCLMCQTYHQISDMVENTDIEGTLKFFCSNRCMMVSNSLRPSTLPEHKLLNDLDIEEMKIPVNLDFIKTEALDENYHHTTLSTVLNKSIKEEPRVGKELNTKTEVDSLFSIMEDSATNPNAVASVYLPATCSKCTMPLSDGETVYQRKGHADIFCSTSCLLEFYQLKRVMKTCHFCLQVISQPQDAVQGPVDSEKTKKDFCHQSCLSSFNYKRLTSAKLPLMPDTSQSLCSVCSRYCHSKYEVTQKNITHKMCSHPCFVRFCTINQLSVCDNCSSTCNSPVQLKMEDGNKKLCSTECLNQFKQKMTSSQTCAMCSNSCLMSAMVQNKTGDDFIELFCSTSCLLASKIQAVSASGIQLNCDNCGESTLPACHLAMSDASIRNFCTLTCAMSFKENPTAAANPPVAPDRSHCEFFKPPGMLLCSQCQRNLDKKPKVIQKKDKLHFVCSLACSEAFKKANSIVGMCEYCKNVQTIGDIKRVNEKDCCFCSEECFVFFCDELKKNWGDHCHSCTYCLSITKTLVTAPYGGAKKEFCSEECNSKYNRLLCHIARCDTCSHEGKLGQSLQLLGEVKHFCDLKCLLHYCNQQVQVVDTGTAESSPVITNVLSLAGALSRQSKFSASSSHHVSIPDIQSKVVGHASVQTVPNEVKNKSTLCSPLSHNKGVSCTPQTVEKGVQTDNTVPKPTVLPVPVPVYVPVPMNMYSQYVPTPTGIPLPLPVPIFLSLTPTSLDPSVRQGVQSCKEEQKIVQDEKYKMKDRPKGTVVTVERQKEEDQANPTQVGIANEGPPSCLGVEKAPQISPKAAQAALLQQPVEYVHRKNEGLNLQETPNPAKTSHRGAGEVRFRKPRKLKSQTGNNAWKRWMQWRESQTNLYLVSSPAVTLNQNILQCSPAELSEGLVCFITEVKRPDGQPYSPDYLFYLCLSIQQYLFENGCTENIFSDHIYSKFSEVLAQTLRAFNPSCTASGSIYSRVEEEFLWDCKQLGVFSPIVLLNTLLFFCCKHFGFTTVEQHRQLSFAHLMRCTKTGQSCTKTTFLRFYPPICVKEFDGVPMKKHKSENKDDILEMLENAENPLRCPVRLYEFYLSKCFKSVLQRSDLFYLQPHASCTPSSPVWYSSTPLDDRTLEAMLVRILAVKELRGVNKRGPDQQISGDMLLLSDEDSD
ncbi:uncharacterized protein isoform X2 [Takifugu rubripes]|uniref:uncharacterized protein isoform X2 n=1 Tax=Takifugu rubripes TaxID=31033 RepID=UPI001145F8B1|nr:uncharacterized protein LOC101074798 isoform X2 [Takifugu rubripes]